MTDTRAKMPDGFFTDLPDDCIREISQYTSIPDSLSWAATSRRHNALLRRPAIKRYLQNLAIVEVVSLNGNVFCITQDGHVLACGENSHGELGLGHTDEVKRFTIIPDLTNIKQVKMIGGWSTLFITYTGEVYVTGNVMTTFNTYPKRFITPSTIPRRFLPDRKIIKTEDDGVSSCFLTDNGELIVLGVNAYGELGMDSTLNADAPTQITGIPFMRDLHYTGSNLYLLTKDNLLYVCGDNSYGQLGLNDRDDRAFPVRVPYLTNIKSIDHNINEIYALTNAGEVYAWGNNDEGELGFGNNHEYNRPELLKQLTNIASMIINDNSFFITTKGDVYVMGSNANGELGLNHNHRQLTPVLHPTLRGVKKIWVEEDKVFFITFDNDIFVTGKVNIFDDIYYYVSPQAISHSFYANIEQICVDYTNDTRIWRTQDGVLYMPDKNWFGDNGENSSIPNAFIQDPPAKILRNASIGDLLFYSEGNGGYAKYCYQLAIERLWQIVTPTQLVNALHQLNSSSWRNHSELKMLLPAYHLILRHVNNPAHQQNADAVISAWAQLLVLYWNLSHPGTGNPQQLYYFLDLLKDINSHQNQARFFQPLSVARHAKRNLLAQLQADPDAIAIAANFLRAELPRNEKRKSDDELEPERDVKKFKK